ncbi:hypothetical protein Moror_9619 [Moniliophthora roreri MCA 2997]|uniref:Uncharacterized protein n=1 Tax=Moniliophthora roreri (strain MCA 2997) TaxID=1381753 RepID=V2WJT8_MONRO|nr:hypothetical protein Moror_9619 [Moniliophthora roreri MCA 2997]
MLQFRIEEQQMTETLLISGLGPEHFILGLLWLQDYNPDINWVMGVMKFRPGQKILARKFIEVLDKTADSEMLIRSFIQGEEDSDEIQINAKLSASQVLAQTYEMKAKPLEELISPYLSDYTDQFKKEKAEQFPPSHP